MKLGTFVGKKTIAFSAEEKAYIENTVKAFFEKNYPSVKYNIEIKNSMAGLNGICIFVHMFDKVRNYRDSNNNLVNPQYINMLFYKSIGYDEAVTGPFYKWPEGFKPEYNISSFSLSAHVNGHERGYKRKNIYYHTNLGKNHYVFDTELSELEIDNTLSAMSKYIDSLKPCKKNII